MRALFYGIPILVVGVLAALPFRRSPESGDSHASQQAPAAGELRIEPIEELPLSELADWNDGLPAPAADPLRSLGESLPPMPESYQAIAIPLDRPSKIADRFSATVGRDRNAREGRNEVGPLVGHPAALASTTTPRDSKTPASQGGWEKSIPIGRPDPADRVADQGKNPLPGRPLAAEPTNDYHLLPPPSAEKATAAASDPWPSLTELASVKQEKPSLRDEGSAETKRADSGKPATTVRERSGAAGVAEMAQQASSQASERDALALPATSDSAEQDRKRYFIREPARS